MRPELRQKLGQLAADLSASASELKHCGLPSLASPGGGHHVKWCWCSLRRAVPSGLQPDPHKHLVSTSLRSMSMTFGVEVKLNTLAPGALSPRESGGFGPQFRRSQSLTNIQAESVSQTRRSDAMQHVRMHWLYVPAPSAVEAVLSKSLGIV